MKQSLTTLDSLVKRRGHTNDPTEEISRALRQFEDDAKELASLKVIPLPLASSQQKRHYEFVSAWLQAVASQQTQQLKEVMKTRGAVLNDQAQRRKMLNPAKASSKPQSTLRASSSISESPLFTMTGNGSTLQKSSLAANGGTTSSAPSSYGGYSGYGGNGFGGDNGYGGGYGGGSGYGSTGMRQRKAAHATEIDMQVQIQERQQKRQTQSRLESARQAEKSLAELSTLFGKMSTLIVQQGEVLEKVEDDVEAALGDVSAGEQEIQTLYKIKKGNRALILKVFGILIFFILFMRLY
jgi:syntaxin 5